ncbi:ABC transporter, permease protein [hydrothermal vent metagenome]|uniref:ABC transporter, permease protein n=1 Tax=hydrothermal vent metagenome TaxID=652676 RepID=A0A1W1BNL2_9ZZZZ
MKRSNIFLHFLTLLLFKERSKHIGIVFISVVIIFLLSSVLFLSSSIQNSITSTLKTQPDFILSKLQGANVVNTPIEWIDDISKIDGISQIMPRVYGRYLFEPKGKSFLIIGVDFFDEVNQKNLKKIIDDINLKEFFASDNMIVGDGVKRFMNNRFYRDKFSFKMPNGEFKDINIYKTIPKEANLISNDMIIMPIDLAKEIFGMKDNEVTDISFNVINNSEWDTIITKIHLLFYNVRVMNKDEISKSYTSLYNYKGGFFIILYLVTIITFMLILYHRYSMVLSSEKKDIGILRALGWSIKDILKLKFYETLLLIIISFILGVILAYIYVFIFNAPIIKDIFLGGGNLENNLSFIPTIEFGTLSSILIFYAVPFLASVLIPVWRVAVTSPKEAML